MACILAIADDEMVCFMLDRILKSGGWMGDMDFLDMARMDAAWLRH